MRFLLKYLDQQNGTRIYHRKLAILLLVFVSSTQLLFSQVLKDIDEIFPFKGEMAAIKKGNQWAFINKKGTKIIDFRNDLVATKDETSTKIYPQFMEGKCLIKKKVDGVYQYGYIDKKGKTVIEPKFLNATNFKHGHALIIKLEQNKIGSNSVLGKSINNSKLEEYVIDTTGKTIKYLENARGYIPSKKSPLINAKFIARNLVAVKALNGKWTVHKF